MPDWTKSMTQTFEYYIVDPGTWKDDEKLQGIISSTVSRDYNTETLGSAILDVNEALDECYIRIYLVTIQNGVTEKFPLGTYLVQTPSTAFDGKKHNISLDAYTPLMELKENLPPLGYSILKGGNVMKNAYELCREKMRAPVSETLAEDVLHNDFVANTNDTWLTYISDLINNAKYEFDMDGMGNILFSPIQDTTALQPVWEYNDDNSSILYPEISVDRDMYGIPNVVEIIYSNEGINYHSRVVNDDIDSPISTVRRGREITHREVNPSFPGAPTQHQIDEYANRILREMSCLEYTVTYTHGYCPARINDCVRLNYKRAGIVDVKAKVISQSIKCESGCQVTEKAIYTTKLWG